MLLCQMFGWLFDWKRNGKVGEPFPSNLTSEEIRCGDITWWGREREKASGVPIHVALPRYGSCHCLGTCFQPSGPEMTVVRPVKSEKVCTVPRSRCSFTKCAILNIVDDAAVVLLKDGKECVKQVRIFSDAKYGSPEFLAYARYVAENQACKSPKTAVDVNLDDLDFTFEIRNEVEL